MPTDKLLPLSDDDFAVWRRRISLSRELRRARMTVWKDCVQAYLGKSLLTTPDHDQIVVNKEFPFLEQKKAQLVFQVPEVQLKPTMPGLETAVRLFQSVINHELGPDGANVKDTLDEVIFDVLAMGIGPTKIGYAAVVGEREVQEPEIDPLTGQPRAVDPMTGQPATRTVKRPYLVHEDYFWRRISPTKFLLPHDFEGMNYDEAPWLAFEFEKDLAFAREEYSLPADFEGSRPEDADESLSGEKESVVGDVAKRKMCGIEIWYYAAQFDAKEPDPRKVRCLVLVDGYDKPVRHQDSPYQKLNAQGQLMGMRGLPLHVLTLRGVAGCAYPPSDIELSKHISDEASKGRTQMVLQRETSIPMRWALKTGMDPDTLNKVLKGHWQAVIPVDQNGNEVLGEVARAQFPRENFTFYEIADRDYEEMWALGRAQRGLTEDAMRTATELQMVSSAANVRLDSERTRVLTFFTRGARKFGALLQLFKTQTGYVEILGQQAQGLQAWNREAIQGEFVFQAKPDSALRMDAAVERKQALDLYNLTGRDPNVRRVELLKSLFSKFNMDPAQIVVEQLPSPPPEKPNVSINVKAEDLVFPSPVLVEVLKQYGITVQPQPQGGPMPPGMPPPMPEGGVPPPHGGPQPEMPALNKHQLRGTGEAPAGVAQRPGTVQ